MKRFTAELRNDFDIGTAAAGEARRSRELGFARADHVNNCATIAIDAQDPVACADSSVDCARAHVLPSLLLLASLDLIAAERFVSFPSPSAHIFMNANGIQFLASGGVVTVLSETTVHSSGLFSAEIVTTDAAGAVIWRRTFLTTGGASVFGVTATGTVVVQVVTASVGRELIAIDSSGTTRWRLALGEIAVGSFKLHDGKLFALGARGPWQSRSAWSAVITKSGVFERVVESELVGVARSSFVNIYAGGADTMILHQTSYTQSGVSKDSLVVLDGSGEPVLRFDPPSIAAEEIVVRDVQAFDGRYYLFGNGQAANGTASQNRATPRGRHRQRGRRRHESSGLVLRHSSAISKCHSGQCALSVRQVRGAL